MDLSFQPGLGLQRHFLSGSQSCCFTDPGEGNLTVQVFPVCLAKTHWTPKMRLRARLWLTQTALAGLSLSGNRGRVSPVTLGVAARSKNERSVIPAPHGDLRYSQSNYLPFLMPSFPLPRSDLGGVHPSKSRHLFNKQGLSSCSKLEACVITVLQDLRAS